mgnify:CR=1 FL=1
MTSGTLNYELVKEFVLTVEAKDAGDPPMRDTCVVTIYVQDANDNEPVFSQAAYFASVREDANIGDSVIKACPPLFSICS